MVLKALVLGTVLCNISVAAMSAEIDQSRFEAILYNKRVSDLGSVSFRSLPTKQDIARVFSPKSQFAYRIRWDCSISGNGHLKNCKLDAVWPDKLNLRLLDELRNKVRLDSQTVDKARQHHARVFLIVYLDDGRRHLDRSCPSGWCPSTPAPPEGTSRPSPSQ